MKIINSASEDETENERCLQMVLEMGWGEARRLATFLRRRWLEPSATELWTRQESLLQAGDRKPIATLRLSQKTDPDALEYNLI